MAEQTTSAWQSEETVQVTVTDPPQNDGAAGALLLITALHPPLYTTVDSHVAYAASIADCV